MPLRRREPSRRTTILAGAGYAALAAADTYLAGKPGKAAKRLRYLVKPALMPLLGTAFDSATGQGTSALKRGTLAAEAFSWGGDVALLGSSERAFLTGVGSFGAGHLGYIAALLSVRGDSFEFDQRGVRAAGVLWLTLTPVLAYAAGRKDPALRLPVAGYATLLASMFAASWTLDPRLRRSGRHLIRMGTTLFLLSDSILGAQEFLLKEPDPRLERAVMATYTTAQALIASGAAILVVDEDHATALRWG